MARSDATIASFRIALGELVAHYSEVDEFLSLSSNSANAMEVVFANVRADDPTHFEIQYSAKSRMMYLARERYTLIGIPCSRGEAAEFARRLLIEVLDADQ